MILRTACLSLLAAGLLAGAELRLHRRAPDGRLRLGPEYRAAGQIPLSLVLGGGSSKGLAHLGVFEVLEEEGIVEDAITGTSAGALMGAFRASGLPAAALRQAFRQVDFGQAIFDSRRRTAGTSLSEEEERQATLWRFERRAGGWDSLPGESTGRAATLTLMGHLLRADALCHGEFARLKTPFACVASDLSSGRLRTFTEGSLVTAVRASMSIPGVFRPVHAGVQQLVDGGVSQNLPVLVARRAHPGALQLAVDVSDPWEGGPASNPFSLVGRSLAHSIEVMTELNRESADLLVRPQVAGFDVFDFHSRVDELAERGRRAMAAALPALEERLYGADGARPLAGKGWRFLKDGHTGDEPRALVELARVCLPVGRGWCRRDGYRLLRRALALGLVADVWLVEPETADGALEIRWTGAPAIRNVQVSVPGFLDALVRRRAGELGLVEGGTFREPAFRELLGSVLLSSSLRGRPLLDVRECGFDAEGTLKLTVAEPVVAELGVDVAQLSPSSERVLLELLRPMLGRPLDATVLADHLVQMDRSLNFQDPSARLESDAAEAHWLLRVAATDQRRLQVNLAAAYETTWGLHGVLDAWLKDMLTKGLEGRVHAFGDRIQQGMSLSLRGYQLSEPSRGFFLGARANRHRFQGDPLLGYFGEVPDPAGYQALIEGARQGYREGFVGVFHRYGTDRKGLLELELQHRISALQPAAHPWVQNRQDALLLSAEWDSFDRSFFPTEGLLVRARAVAGRTRTWVRMDPQPAPLRDQFRSGYLLARALARDVAGPVGADLSLEAGAGWSTLLISDRQFILGGDASLIGTPSTRFLAPNFAILRAGLPIAVRRAFGGHVQIVPRLDFGRFAQNPYDLTAGMRVLGQGLVIRGAVGRLYIETGWGAIQSRPFGPGGLRREHQFNVLVGARPFDLWVRN